MKKWIIWITDWEGEYVRATKAVESKNTVSFIFENEIISRAVKTYKLKDIKEYHIVE